LDRDVWEVVVDFGVRGGSDIGVVLGVLVILGDGDDGLGEDANDGHGEEDGEAEEEGDGDDEEESGRLVIQPVFLPEYPDTGSHKV
jgi:hypothetical protein